VGRTVRQSGLLLDEITTVVAKTFNSKAQGAREDAEIKQWGRMDFDVLHLLRRDLKKFRK
jgi:hypothetical protein